MRREVWNWGEPSDFATLTKRLAIHWWRDGVTRTYRVGAWAVSITRHLNSREVLSVTVKPAHEAVRPYWHRREDDWRVPFKGWYLRHG